MPTSTWFLKLNQADSIQFTALVRDFCRERGDLEREYSRKLDSLGQKYLPKSLSRDSVRPSVRDGWERVVLETLEAAHFHSIFADTMAGKIQETLKVFCADREVSRRKHVQYLSQFLAERDSIFQQVESSKELYQTKCNSVQSSKARYEKAGDEKTKERYQRLWHEDILDMGNAKNSYLIDIEMANSLRDRYYSIESGNIVQGINDYSADLGDSLVDCFAHITQARTALSTTLTQLSETTSNLLKDVDSKLQKYVLTDKVHRLEREPVFYQQCGMWKDDAEMIQNEYATTYLQNKLVQLNALHNECSHSLQVAENSAAGLDTLYTAYKKNPMLGDESEVREVCLISPRND